MLEHQQDALEQAELRSHDMEAVNSPMTTFAFSPQAQALIANYLAQIGEDRASLPQAEQDETDGEAASTSSTSSTLYARLEMLIAGHLELDATPELAVEAAIRQLERERMDSEAAQTTSQKQALRPRHSAKSAARIALTLFGGGMLAPLAFSAAFTGSSDPHIFALMMFLIFGLPALLGVGVGLRARHRPATGTFYALALLIPFASVFAAVIALLHQQGWMEGMWFGVDMLLFWMPIGCLMAALTGWARDSRIRRQNKRKHAVITQDRNQRSESSYLFQSVAGTRHLQH